MIVFGLGLVAAAVLGYQAGQSTTVHTSELFTSSDTQSHAARGVGVFVAAVLGTFITTSPLLGISWLLEGQADLMERDQVPESN